MGTVAAYTDSQRSFISSAIDCIGFLRTEKYYHILADGIQKIYTAPILMVLVAIPEYHKRQNDSQRSPLHGPKSLLEIKPTH